jgi:CDP-diacylglycerol--serine O-phosphatidyltransferase
VAALLDSLDGAVARMLNAGSPFGAELDSLSDLVSFGVAPALMLHIWVMNQASGIGWVIVLLFSVCCALRLARFNTTLDDDKKPAKSQRYFTGVPAPAGAGLVLLPMIMSFEFGWAFLDSVWTNGVVLLLVAGLMVSRLPSYSLKRVRIPHRFVMPTLLFVVGAAAFVVARPWMTLSVMVIAYAISLPFAAVTYRRMEARNATFSADDLVEDVNLEETPASRDRL